jgi:hypothetical protein
MRLPIPGTEIRTLSSMIMVNKYPGICDICGAPVPQNGGNVEKVNGSWVVTHLACKASGLAEVITTRFSDGAVIYQNRRGRCEDAPCCGCCS